MALLCLVTLVAGFLGLRRGPGETSMAIRADAAGGTSPSADVSSGPQTPSPPEATATAISLSELAQDLRPGPSPPTTRPGTTVTTTKPGTTTTTRPPTTTTVKAAPAPAATPTTAVTTPLTPLTTLLAGVVPPAVAVTGGLTRTDSGVASWFNAPDTTCAHRTLPMGTVIKVTRTYNGASANCKVNDRGPTAETGRLIDLSLDTFEKLASKEAGLIEVKIEW